MNLSFYTILYLINQFFVRRKQILAFSTFALLIAAAFGLLNKYLIWDFNLYLGLLFLPFILYIKQHNVFSYRYGILSTIMLIAYIFIPVLTIYYLAFCFAALFIVENVWGKVNNAILVLIVLLGSISRYFINVFSFSIRLKLSEYASNILNAIGFENTVKGNVIQHSEQSFSVDPECIGLKMVVTAFLIMLLFITFFERRNRVSLSLTGIGIISLVNFFLIIFNNLMRIVALVIFKSAPDTFSHEAIGVAGLILYNILPLYIITPFVISFFGRKYTPDPVATKDNKWFPVMIIPIIMGLFVFNLIYKIPEQFTDSELEQLNLSGFDKKTTDHNVVKFFNDDALIYVKPPARFYGSDHNPYICWLGSGYSFQNIEIKTIDGVDVYIAELISESDILYTSWWYDNTKHQTIDQWDWRWRTIKGEKPFRLINVSCENQSELNGEIVELLKMNRDEER